MQDVAIFICYRRADTNADAGRLYDALRRRFGRESLFMDVDTLRPGQDWVEAIDTAVAKCDVFLAVIGDDWLDAADDTGQRRLDSDLDRVRLEIEAALRLKKRIIPVLFDTAKMPAASDLPASLGPLVRRHSIRIAHANFEADLSRLVRTLRGAERAKSEPASDLSPASAATHSEQPSRRSRPFTSAALAIAGLATAAVVLAVSAKVILDRPPATASAAQSSKAASTDAPSDRPTNPPSAPPSVLGAPVTAVPSTPLGGLGPTDGTCAADARTGEKRRAQISSPQRGTTLAAREVEFRWSPADPLECVVSYSLSVGRTIGGDEFTGVGVVCTQLPCDSSASVADLPFDHSRVYVRLFTSWDVRSGGQVVFYDASYEAGPMRPTPKPTLPPGDPPTPLATSTAPQTPTGSVLGMTATPFRVTEAAKMSSPLEADGPLAGPTIAFAFGGAVGDVLWYSISVGTTQGGYDIEVEQTRECPGCAAELTANEI